MKEVEGEKISPDDTKYKQIESDNHKIKQTSIYYQHQRRRRHFKRTIQ
jgi:hypothetical protein